MTGLPFGGDPIFSSPFSGDTEDVVIPPVQTFFVLQEQTNDRILLESGDAMLTEMAM